jgi:DNA-binding NtrC family response regulator
MATKTRSAWHAAHCQVEGDATTMASMKAMRALVVEDDDTVRERLYEVLSESGMDVRTATCLRDAAVALEEAPQLVILDIGLPDGNGVHFAELASQRRPTPAIIAISGRADATEAFALGRIGVRGYLGKPLNLTRFTAVIESVLESSPVLDPHIVALVGHKPFHLILNTVRRVLAEQALALSGGNKTQAAELLSVTRQAVQHMIRELEIR